MTDQMWNKDCCELEGNKPFFMLWVKVVVLMQGNPTYIEWKGRKKQHDSVCKRLLGHGLEDTGKKQ